MSQTVKLSIPAKGQPSLGFPDRCVCCGAPARAESTLAVNRLVRRGRRQVPLALTYMVPHCEKCGRLTNSILMIGLVPFILGFLLVGGGALITAFVGGSIFGVDDLGQPSSYALLTLTGASALFGGLIGGFLFELAARLFLLPFYGRALLQAPLLTTQMLRDTDYVAGLTGGTDGEGRQLSLIFANDAVAREFIALNASMLVGGGSGEGVPP